MCFCLCACLHAYACICACACVHSCLHVCMMHSCLCLCWCCVCFCVCIVFVWHVCVCVSVEICVYLSLCVRACVCVRTSNWSVANSMPPASKQQFWLDRFGIIFIFIGCWCLEGCWFNSHCRPGNLHRDLILGLFCHLHTAWHEIRGATSVETVADSWNASCVWKRLHNC